jgi:sporulation protein YlmC with PRC-barrel domain
MEIPLNAQVECTDGVCGLSEYVLINPVIDEVSHLVVKAVSSLHTEYIVPIELLGETISGTIHLCCSIAELEKMDPFIKTRFIDERIHMNFANARGMYAKGSYYYLPYVTPEKTLQVPVGHKQIPPGELTVRRGTHIEATDGYVGQVDEFVVNPENDHITHVVMREGHLMGQKDVIIPISEMGDTRDDTVFLKLDKHQVESLPTFPIHRRWS